jgi:hypothetical protein
MQRDAISYLFLSLLARQDWGADMAAVVFCVPHRTRNSGGSKSLEERKSRSS